MFSKPNKDKINFVKYMPGPIELNIKKQKITPKPMPEVEGSLEVDVYPECPDKKFNLTNSKIVEWLHKTNQSGYQNKSIEESRAIPGESSSYVNVKTGLPKFKTVNIEQEYTNDFLKKSKFGYNPDVPDNSTTNKKLQTFGVKDSTIKNRLKNGCESDVGYQGYIGGKLWMSNYLNREGTGKF